MTNEIGYLIQVNDETKEGYHYLVSQDFLIGNSVQCNLKIFEDGISDKHCRIKLVDDEVRRTLIHRVLKVQTISLISILI